MNFPVPSRNYITDVEKFVGDYIDRFTRFWNDHNQAKLVWDFVSATIGYFGNGTVGAPSISFASDTDTGWYRIGANNPGLSAGNTKVIDAKSSGLAIIGSNTNDDAAAGWVGEVISSTCLNLAATTTNQYGDATSISLTAGVWIISVNGNWLSQDTTTQTFEIGVSTTSGNSGTGLNVENGNRQLIVEVGVANNDRRPIVIPAYKVKLTTTTTHYLKYKAVYPSGIPQLTAIIQAERPR